MKIALIGYSGSGKSTLAGILGLYYNIPVLYLDTVQFLPGWQERKDEEALMIVNDFMENNDWVIDGNYRKYLRDRRLEEADCIIFMNFTRVNSFYRVFKRYRKYKNKTRESMAEGCNEKLDLDFIKWILYKGRTKGIRNKYKEIINKYNYKTITIKNQKQLDKFINDLEN